MLLPYLIPCCLIQQNNPAESFIDVVEKTVFSLYLDSVWEKENLRIFSNESIIVVARTGEVQGIFVHRVAVFHNVNGIMRYVNINGEEYKLLGEQLKSKANSIKYKNATLKLIRDRYFEELKP